MMERPMGRKAAKRLKRAEHAAKDVVKLLDAINLQKEESKLFQFLNGLDEQYNSQQSQLLLQTPLPTVQVACSVLEQEEAQRAVLGLTNSGSAGDAMAMFSKNNSDTGGVGGVVCSVCGAKGLNSDRCWRVIGFPRWHPRHNKNAQGGNRRNFSPNKAHNTNQNHSNPKFAANVQTDEEIDYHFSGMISCFNVAGASSDWIVDSGALGHMTPYHSNLVHITALLGTHSINLPTGDGVVISEKGHCVFLK